ncbi:hypothetical protein [Streptomyces laurentii]|uniref:hypothetical protein n=1 Tax=Streptomyces laurentii TaxID=39478 RepID=UPI003410A227
MGLLLILWCALGWAPSRPGRHSAAYRAPEALPTLTGPRMTPWSTPTPEHVHARRTPLRGEDTALIRPYVFADAMLNLGTVCERRRALDAAAQGHDYPYSYPGAPFPAEHAAATGVTA